MLVVADTKTDKVVRFQNGFFALRPATEADLNDITRIHIEGFTEEPQVHYCYPLRKEYPEDHWKWTRHEYENYLKQPSKYVVHVLVSTTTETDEGTVMEIAGVSVWNMAVLTEAINESGSFRSALSSFKQRMLPVADRFSLLSPPLSNRPRPRKEERRKRQAL